MVLTKKKFLKLLEENTGFKQNISIGITINIDQKLLLKEKTIGIIYLLKVKKLKFVN